MVDGSFDSNPSFITNLCLICSVLPSDEWFLEAARIAIDKLSEDWNQRSVAQELVDAVGV